MNTITRDFGYMPVEFRGDWVCGLEKFTTFCVQWIRLVGVQSHTNLGEDFVES